MKKFLVLLTSFSYCWSVWSQADTQSLGVLPAEISETSGLLYHNNTLITHNDSGNTAELFVLDTLSREILRKVTIGEAVNTDWEDLASDDVYIYIGDIGNNQGTRTDLGIYRIAKQDLDASDTVTAERISYNYEDQTDFSGGANSDWDAEALIVVGDSLVVFTKQWQSNGTVAYSIPKIPGTYQATRLDSYDSNGLVTGATYNAESQLVYLCGYSQQLFPFIVRIEGIQDSFAFGNSSVRSALPLSFTQVEGIVSTNINTYYMSSERFVNTSPPITLESQLFKFTTADTAADPPVDPPPPDPTPIDPPDDPMPTPVPEIEDVLLYQETGSNVLGYDLGLERPFFGRAIFDATGRRIQYTPANEILQNNVDLSTLGSAIYYITFYFEGEVISKPFYRR